MQHHYEHLILGAGRTGMRLAHSLAKSSSLHLHRPEGKILVADPSFGALRLTHEPQRIRSLLFALMARARDAASWLQRSKKELTSTSALLDALQGIKYDALLQDQRLEQLRSAGISTICARGTIGEGRSITLEPIGQEAPRPFGISASYVWLTTGSQPHLPHIDGLKRSKALSAEDLLHLTKAPRSVTLVGGGALGCSLAQALALLDMPVTLIEKSPHLLDPSLPLLVRKGLEKRLLKCSVALHTASQLRQVKGAAFAKGLFEQEGKSACRSKGPPQEEAQLLIENRAGQLSWHQSELLLFTCGSRPTIAHAAQKPSSFPFLFDPRRGVATDLEGRCLRSGPEQEIDSHFFAFGSGAFSPKCSLERHSREKYSSKNSSQSREEIMLRAIKRIEDKRKSRHFLRWFLPAFPFVHSPLKQATSSLSLSGKALFFRKKSAGPKMNFIPCDPPLLQLQAEGEIDRFKSFVIDFPFQATGDEELLDMGQEQPKRRAGHPSYQLEEELELLEPGKERAFLAGKKKDALTLSAKIALEQALHREEDASLPKELRAQLVVSLREGRLLAITMMAPQVLELSCALQEAMRQGATLEEIAQMALAKQAPGRLFERALALWQNVAKKGY